MLLQLMRAAGMACCGWHARSQECSHSCAFPVLFLGLHMVWLSCCVPSWPVGALLHMYGCKSRLNCCSLGMPRWLFHELLQLRDVEVGLRFNVLLMSLTLHCPSWRL
jgi:hypothetical protein